MTKQKDDRKYLDWIMTLGCIANHKHRKMIPSGELWLTAKVDPDHVKREGHGKMGGKDRNCVIPLCRWCHTTKGNIGEKRFFREVLGKEQNDMVDIAEKLWAVKFDTVAARKILDVIKWESLGIPKG